MPRHFGNCRDKWKCKLVGTGRCDKHPDCERGAKCSFLAKRKCTFYHPPHHFALTNIERRHRSHSTISDNSRDDEYHNGHSMHHNRSRRHSSSRKRKRKHKKTKRTEHSAEHIIPSIQWTESEENELISFVQQHRIYEYFPQEKVQEIKKKLNRSLNDIKLCLLRLRKEGRINNNIYNNKNETDKVIEHEVDDEETKMNHNDNDGINALRKSPGSPLMEYIKQNNNKITDKLNLNNNKGINGNDFHFGNLLTTNPYFNGLNVNDNNNNNNNNTSQQEMEEKKIEQNGNNNGNQIENEMDLSIVNNSNVPALQYENVPALKYEFLCQDDEDDTNNDENATIDTEKRESEDIINNGLIANEMTEDHVDKIIDINTNNNNNNNNMECNNMNIDAADNGTEREEIITQNVNVEDIQQEKQNVDETADEQEIKMEKPSDSILGLEQIETCFEQNHHNALIQGSDYSVQHIQNDEITTSDIVEDIDYSKSNTIDVSIDDEENDMNIDIDIKYNDVKEENHDNTDSEDEYIITDSMNNDEDHNEMDRKDVNATDTNNDNKNNNRNSNNNNNNNKKRKYSEMIEEDENDIDIEEEKDDKITRMKELEILSLSLTLKGELEKGVELLSNMRVMDDEENQNKYIKLLQKQIDCIKQSNLEMYKHQNMNTRARIGDIVRARNSRGHIRKKRRK